MGFPWMAQIFADRASLEPITFTLRNFTSDPVTISLILSINVLFNFMVGVAACYLSDRIWTRLGRRRPFLIIGFSGAALMLALVPLMPSLWSVITVIVAFQFFVDFARPWEALYNEVIPPPQRGRGGLFRMLLQNVGNLLFSTVLIGQYDRVYHGSVWGIRLTGDKVAYWGCALMLLLAALFFAFAVREDRPDPAGPPRPDGPDSRGGFQLGRRFLEDVFGDRQNLWVYFLYLCPVVGAVGTNVAGGALFLLFQTEQLGITKAQLGHLYTWVLPFQILVSTPVAGLLADRWDRMTMVRVGLVVPALLWFSLILYARSRGFQVPLGIVIGVEILKNFFITWLWVTWGPLVFDYIPSNRMGTFMAGFTTVAGLTGFALQNWGGLWVKAWTSLFGHSGPAAYDYSSIGFCTLIMSCGACAATFLFTRAEKRGWVKPLGRALPGPEASAPDPRGSPGDRAED